MEKYCIVMKEGVLGTGQSVVEERKHASTFLGAELLYNSVCPYVRDSGEISFRGIYLLLE